MRFLSVLTRVTLLAVTLAAGMPPSALRAQEPPRIAITLPGAGAGAAPGAPASIAVRGVLADRGFEEALRSGFPARVHVRAELWTVGRWVDDLADQAEWDVIVRHDPLDRSYEVARITREGVTALGTFATLADARRAAEGPHAPRLEAPVGRRGYLAVRVEAQAIEVSDLDEVRRWLRGEAQPVVRGRRNPGTAIGRGLRTLVTRLLGGEVRYLETRSAEFPT